MIRRLGATLAALGIVACSSAPEDVGRSNDAVDYICKETASATLDGIPAYAYCGNFNVWSNNGVDTRSSSGGTGWVQTEGGYGYQCVEYAVRYEHFKFGVGTAWGISYAYQMCNTHPSSMSKAATPVHGDLMIFAPGSCGADKTAGHVAVVDTVGSTSVKVVQENTASSYTFNRSCASCWLHAAKNTGDPCATAPSSGLYCGQSTQWGGGTKDVLYTCTNGVTASKTTCAYGCVVEPPNTNDQCAPAPDAGSDASSDASPGGDAAAPPSDAAPPPQADAAPPPPPQDDAGAGAGHANETGGCTTSGAGAPGSHMVGAAGLLLATLALRRRRR